MVVAGEKINLLLRQVSSKINSDVETPRIRLKKLSAARTLIVTGVILYILLLLYTYKRVLMPTYYYRGYVIYEKRYCYSILVFLMSIEKSRFRNPVIPDCELLLKIEAIRSHGRVWKYKGEAFVENVKMADAIWSATIVDRK